MKPWLAITRLLPILAVVAVVLAPFAAPAAARGMIAPMAAADATMDPTSAAYDMAMAAVQCCAPAWPSNSEGPKACPLAALCHATILQGVSTASVMLRWFSPAQALVPGDDAALETLAQAPPSRPPQA